MNAIMLTSNCCCFIFLLILTIIYGLRKKISNDENRIYKWILSCNLLVLIVELLFLLSIYFLNDKFFVILILEKIYFAFIVMWLIVFTYYLVLVSNKKNEKIYSFLQKNKKQNIFLLTIFFIITTCIIFSLPVDHKFKNNYVSYSYGPALNFMVGCIILLIEVSVISIIINIKKINKTKVAPILFFALFESIIYAIRMLYPSITLTSLGMTLISYLMYFTIENPDVKMIEQLNEAKEEAERANQAKTEFLSNMSHEIRTPLNAIVGFAQSLFEEDLSEEAKDEVKDIINASHCLLQIVNGILDISKIEANKLEIVNTEYNFEKIFDESVSLTKGRLSGKPLDFRYSYDSSIPPVLYGDYVRIKQIIVNLLTNAIKYTKRGYIDFKVSSVRKNDICRIIISVEDSGIGIKDEDIDKLFTKFQRFDIENNITIEGTGLGLAITKKLIELMNGKIVVQSIYGEGSKFTVALDQRVIPKTLEELTNELAKDADNVPFMGNGDKILVVDDNNINLKVAKRLLKSYNLNADLVSSGKECINRILDGNKYSMILLDDMMPKMTGVETLINLKKIIGFDTVTIALTANAITGMREKYLESGFDDYLAKPIDKEELEIILKKYLINNIDQNNYQNSNNLVKDVENNNDDIDLLIAYGVDLDKSLELLGDMETFNDTLRDFKEESVTRLANLTKYKEEKDMANYAILVHGMKSDAKYLGLTKLAELSYNHEMASKEGRIDYVNINFQELMDEVNKALELIDKYLNGKGE